MLKGQDGRGCAEMVTVANIPVMTRGWHELSSAGVSVLIFLGISKGYKKISGVMEE